MALDSLQSRQRQVELFERYGPMLTGHQREVLGLYLHHDWSLSEIAQSQETSRAAVYDVIRRASQTLEDLEARLGLLARRAELLLEIVEFRRRLQLLESKLERL